LWESGYTTPSIPASPDAAATAGKSVRPEQPWLDTMLSRLGRLPEDALLEVIHRLVEVSNWYRSSLLMLLLILILFVGDRQTKIVIDP
jgi:hypothetical protein